MLTDMIEVESAPLRDALEGMVGLWLIENSYTTDSESALDAFDKALRAGAITKGRLPVAVVLALYALDYKWPDNGIVG